MNFLSPPTDSLYKFCALSGLTIFFLSYYLPFNLADDLSSKVLVEELNVSI